MSTCFSIIRCLYTGSKITKASRKHRPGSSCIDCIHAVRSLQNAILKCHDTQRKKPTNRPLFASGCSSVFLMWLNLGRSWIIHSEVKHFFNIPSREPFMTIYVSVSCVPMHRELVTDAVWSRQSLHVMETSRRFSVQASITRVYCKCYAHKAVSCFHGAINLRC